MATPTARTWFFYLSPDGVNHTDVVLEGDANACQSAAMGINNSLAALRAAGIVGSQHASAIAAPFAWDFNKIFTGK